VTDFTEADEIAQAFREAAGELAGYFHPDTCQLMRVPVDAEGKPIKTPDGYGGWTEAPAPHGAPFRCRLDADQRIGSEGIAGSVVLSVSSYTVEMPYDTDVQATDTLQVNGRTFEVTDPKRGGKQDMFLVVGVEERT
jgi:hypothetical protein